MFFQIILELLPGFADDKFHRGFFAAFDTDKTAGPRQNQFFDDIFHVADLMRQHRRHFPADIKFNGAFDPDRKTVRGKEFDHFGAAAHFKPLALEVDFDHSP